MLQSIEVRRNRSGNLTVTYRWKSFIGLPDPIGDYESICSEIGLSEVSLPSVKNPYMIAMESDAHGKVRRVYYAPDNGLGWVGNLDPPVYRYHGWRGSYNDIATTALGLRACLSITPRRYKHASSLRIVFGKDRAKNQP